MVERLTGIEDEAVRLVRMGESGNLTLRLLGGVAIALSCPAAGTRPELVREYNDIDVATHKKSSRAVRDMLTAQGYRPDTHFNALHGATRLLFYDEDNERKLDVFLGVFEMCNRTRGVWSGSCRAGGA